MGVFVVVEGKKCQVCCKFPEKLMNTIVGLHNIEEIINMNQNNTKY